MTGEEKPKTFELGVGTHRTLVSGREYEGDRYEDRYHLSVTTEILGLLGWDRRTFLTATIVDGKLVIEKDAKKHREDLEQKRWDIENKIGSKKYQIKRMQDEIAKMKKEIEELEQISTE